MPTTVEYLLVSKADTLCDSIETFNSLLLADSVFAIKGSQLIYKGDFPCTYLAKTGEITGAQQRFFHLHFSIDNESDAQLEAFSELLKAVRRVIHLVSDSPAIIWDDISRLYAERAYSLIHRIENLMRKLIAHFMLVNVGSQWVSQSVPANVKELLKRNVKRKSPSTILHSLDFIDLADFLVTPYSTVQTGELHEAIRTASDSEGLDKIKTMVPESNWKRYFSSLVDCDDAFIQSRWKDLYDLRCDIAHNASFSKSDLEAVQKLTADIEPKLNEAIAKLPRVTVPESEATQVAERLAASEDESQARSRHSGSVPTSVLKRAAKRHIEQLTGGPVADNGQRFPDFVVTTNERRHGFEIVNVQESSPRARLLCDLGHARNALIGHEIDSITLIVVVRRRAALEAMRSMVQEILRDEAVSPVVVELCSLRIVDGHFTLIPEGGFAR